ncbi:hypothetical protein MWU52_07805 [Jannaschia sp. S6380]|uniref:hypothetical protein n=1 Tax=Jannaschia sp. S6380 TaxID=2926408 RepID=UPI001FF1DF64|nr:hypothetical protein [Jannaschia sp. S6380]MCK0167447.1 hypothetical protein [Jannaschia sp. S6380]
MTGQIAKQGAIFAAIFLIVNLALDVYRAGGLTTGALASSVVTTLVATVLYVTIIAFLRRRDTRK